MDLTPAHSWLYSWPSTLCVVRPRCLSTDARQEGRRRVAEEERRETRWLFGKLDADEAPAISRSFVGASSTRSFSRTVAGGARQVRGRI